MALVNNTNGANGAYGGDQNGIILEKRPSKGRLYSFFVTLIAFASSLLLWFYVLGYDSPHYEKEFNVAVSVSGEATLRENMGFTVLSDFGFSIKVVVSGPQTEVNKLRAGDIKAFVDVSEVSEPGNNTLPISVTVANKNGVTVTEKSVESAIIFIDRNVVAEIPVTLTISDYTLPSGYSAGDYTTTPSTVSVEGPETEISRISYALGLITPGSLTSSSRFNTSVTLYDAGNNKIQSAYINLIDTSVSVWLPIYKTVNLPVKVYFVGGYFSTDAAIITLSDDYITVRGLAEDFEGVSEIKINIAENTLTSDKVIKQISLPAGLKCISGQEYVTATIKFHEIVDRYVAASCAAVCDIIGAPPDKDITVTTANLSIKFMGPRESLLALNQRSFRAVVDLDNMALEKGETYIVPISILLTDKDNVTLAGVFPTGDYVVTIAVSAKEG